MADPDFRHLARPINRNFSNSSVQIWAREDSSNTDNSMLCIVDSSDSFHALMQSWQPNFHRSSELDDDAKFSKEGPSLIYVESGEPLGNVSNTAQHLIQDLIEYESNLSQQTAVYYTKTKTLLSNSSQSWLDVTNIVEKPITFDTPSLCDNISANVTNSNVIKNTPSVSSNSLTKLAFQLRTEATKNEFPHKEEKVDCDGIISLISSVTFKNMKSDLLHHAESIASIFLPHDQFLFTGTKSLVQVEQLKTEIRSKVSKILTEELQKLLNTTQDKCKCSCRCDCDCSKYNNLQNLNYKYEQTVKNTGDSEVTTALAKSVSADFHPATNEDGIRKKGSMKRYKTALKKGNAITINKRAFSSPSPTEQMKGCIDTLCPESASLVKTESIINKPGNEKTGQPSEKTYKCHSLPDRKENYVCPLCCEQIEIMASQSRPVRSSDTVLVKKTVLRIKDLIRSSSLEYRSDHLVHFCQANKPEITAEGTKIQISNTSIGINRDRMLSETFLHEINPAVKLSQIEKQCIFSRSFKKCDARRKKVLQNESVCFKYSNDSPLLHFKGSSLCNSSSNTNIVKLESICTKGNTYVAARMIRNPNLYCRCLNASPSLDSKESTSRSSEDSEIARTQHQGSKSKNNKSQLQDTFPEGWKYATNQIKQNPNTSASPTNFKENPTLQSSEDYETSTENFYRNSSSEPILVMSSESDYTSAYIHNQQIPAPCCIIKHPASKGSSCITMPKLHRSRPGSNTRVYATVNLLKSHSQAPCSQYRKVRMKNRKSPRFTCPHCGLQRPELISSNPCSSSPLPDSHEKTTNYDFSKFGCHTTNEPKTYNPRFKTFNSRVSTSRYSTKSSGLDSTSKKPKSQVTFKECIAQIKDASSQKSLYARQNREIEGSFVNIPLNCKACGSNVILTGTSAESSSERIQPYCSRSVPSISSSTSGNTALCCGDPVNISHKPRLSQSRSGSLVLSVSCPTATTSSIYQLHNSDYKEAQFLKKEHRLEVADCNCVSYQYAPWNPITTTSNLEYPRSKDASEQYHHDPELRSTILQQKTGLNIPMVLDNTYTSAHTSMCIGNADTKNSRIILELIVHNVQNTLPTAPSNKDSTKADKSTSSFSIRCCEPNKNTNTKASLSQAKTHDVPNLGVDVLSNSLVSLLQNTHCQCTTIARQVSILLKHCPSTVSHSINQHTLTDTEGEKERYGFELKKIMSYTDHAQGQVDTHEEPSQTGPFHSFGVGLNPLLDDVICAAVCSNTKSKDAAEPTQTDSLCVVKESSTSYEATRKHSWCIDEYENERLVDNAFVLVDPKTRRRKEESIQTDSLCDFRKGRKCYEKKPDPLCNPNPAGKRCNHKSATVSSITKPNDIVKPTQSIDRECIDLRDLKLHKCIADKKGKIKSVSVSCTTKRNDVAERTQRDSLCDFQKGCKCYETKSDSLCYPKMCKCMAVKTGNHKSGTVSSITKPNDKEKPTRAHSLCDLQKGCKCYETKPDHLCYPNPAGKRGNHKSATLSSIIKPNDKEKPTQSDSLCDFHKGRTCYETKPHYLCHPNTVGNTCNHKSATVSSITKRNDIEKPTQMDSFCDFHKCRKCYETKPDRCCNPKTAGNTCNHKSGTVSSITKPIDVEKPTQSDSSSHFQKGCKCYETKPDRLCNPNPAENTGNHKSATVSSITKPNNTEKPTESDSLCDFHKGRKCYETKPHCLCNPNTVENTCNHKSATVSSITKPRDVEKPTQMDSFCDFHKCRKCYETKPDRLCNPNKAGNTCNHKSATVSPISKQNDTENSRQSDSICDFYKGLKCCETKPDRLCNPNTAGNTFNHKSGTVSSITKPNDIGKPTKIDSLCDFQRPEHLIDQTTTKNNECINYNGQAKKCVTCDLADSDASEFMTGERVKCESSTRCSNRILQRLSRLFPNCFAKSDDYDDEEVRFQYVVVTKVNSPNKTLLKKQNHEKDSMLASERNYCVSQKVKENQVTIVPKSTPEETLNKLLEEVMEPCRLGTEALTKSLFYYYGNRKPKKNAYRNQTKTIKNDTSPRNVFGVFHTTEPQVMPVHNCLNSGFNNKRNEPIFKCLKSRYLMKHSTKNQQRITNKTNQLPTMTNKNDTTLDNTRNCHTAHNPYRSHTQQNKNKDNRKSFLYDQPLVMKNYTVQEHPQDFPANLYNVPSNATCNFSTKTWSSDDYKNQSETKASPRSKKMNVASYDLDGLDTVKICQISLSQLHIDCSCSKETQPSPTASGKAADWPNDQINQTLSQSLTQHGQEAVARGTQKSKSPDPSISQGLPQAKKNHHSCRRRLESDANPLHIQYKLPDQGQQWSYHFLREDSNSPQWPHGPGKRESYNPGQVQSFRFPFLSQDGTVTQQTAPLSKMAQTECSCKDSKTKHGQKKIRWSETCLSDASKPTPDLAPDQGQQWSYHLIQQESNEWNGLDQQGLYKQDQSWAYSSRRQDFYNPGQDYCSYYPYPGQDSMAIHTAGLTKLSQTEPSRDDLKTKQRQRIRWSDLCLRDDIESTPCSAPDQWPYESYQQDPNDPYQEGLWPDQPWSYGQRKQDNPDQNQLSRLPCRRTRSTATQHPAALSEVVQCDRSCEDIKIGHGPKRIRWSDIHLSIDSDSGSSFGSDLGQQWSYNTRQKDPNSTDLQGLDWPAQQWSNGTSKQESYNRGQTYFSRLNYPGQDYAATPILETQMECSCKNSDTKPKKNTSDMCMSDTSEMPSTLTADQGQQSSCCPPKQEACNPNQNYPPCLPNQGHDCVATQLSRPLSQVAQTDCACNKSNTGLGHQIRLNRFQTGEPIPCSIPDQDQPLICASCHQRQSIGLLQQSQQCSCCPCKQNLCNPGQNCCVNFPFPSHDSMEHQQPAALCPCKTQTEHTCKASESKMRQMITKWLSFYKAQRSASKLCSRKNKKKIITQYYDNLPGQNQHSSLSKQSQTEFSDSSQAKRGQQKHRWFIESERCNACDPQQTRKKSLCKMTQTEFLDLCSKIKTERKKNKWFNKSKQFDACEPQHKKKDTQGTATSKGPTNAKAKERFISECANSLWKSVKKTLKYSSSPSTLTCFAPPATVSDISNEPKSRNKYRKQQTTPSMGTQTEFSDESSKTKPKQKKNRWFNKCKPLDAAVPQHEQNKDNTQVDPTAGTTGTKNSTKDKFIADCSNSLQKSVKKHLKYSASAPACIATPTALSNKRREPKAKNKSIQKKSSSPSVPASVATSAAECDISIQPKSKKSKKKAVQTKMSPSCDPNIATPPPVSDVRTKSKAKKKSIKKESSYSVASATIPDISSDPNSKQSIKKLLYSVCEKLYASLAQASSAPSDSVCDISSKSKHKDKSVVKESSLTPLPVDVSEITLKPKSKQKSVKNRFYSVCDNLYSTLSSALPSAHVCDLNSEQNSKKKSIRKKLSSSSAPASVAPPLSDSKKPKSRKKYYPASSALPAAAVCEITIKQKSKQKSNKKSLSSTCLPASATSPTEVCDKGSEPKKSKKKTRNKKSSVSSVAPPTSALNITLKPSSSYASVSGNTGISILISSKENLTVSCSPASVSPPASVYCDLSSEPKPKKKSGNKKASNSSVRPSTSDCNISSKSNSKNSVKKKLSNFIASVSGKISLSKSKIKSSKESLAVSCSPASVSPSASVYCDLCTRSEPKPKKKSNKKSLSSSCVPASATSSTEICESSSKPKSLKKSGNKKTSVSSVASSTSDCNISSKSNSKKSVKKKPSSSSASESGKIGLSKSKTKAVKKKHSSSSASESSKTGLLKSKTKGSKDSLAVSCSPASVSPPASVYCDLCSEPKPNKKSGNKKSSVSSIAPPTPALNISKTNSKKSVKKKPASSPASASRKAGLSKPKSKSSKESLAVSCSPAPISPPASVYCDLCTRSEPKPKKKSGNKKKSVSSVAPPTSACDLSGKTNSLKSILKKTSSWFASVSGKISLSKCKTKSVKSCLSIPSASASVAPPAISSNKTSKPESKKKSGIKNLAVTSSSTSFSPPTDVYCDLSSKPKSKEKSGKESLSSSSSHVAVSPTSSVYCDLSNKPKSNKKSVKKSFSSSFTPAPASPTASVCCELSKKPKSKKKSGKESLSSSSSHVAVSPTVSVSCDLSSKPKSKKKSSKESYFSSATPVVASPTASVCFDLSSKPKSKKKSGKERLSSPSTLALASPTASVSFDSSSKPKLKKKSGKESLSSSSSHVAVSRTASVCCDLSRKLKSKKKSSKESFSSPATPVLVSPTASVCFDLSSKPKLKKKSGKESLSSLSSHVALAPTASVCCDLSRKPNSKKKSSKESFSSPPTPVLVSPTASVCFDLSSKPKLKNKSGKESLYSSSSHVAVSRTASVSCDLSSKPKSKKKSSKENFYSPATPALASPTASVCIDLTSKPESKKKSGKKSLSSPSTPALASPTASICCDLSRKPKSKKKPVKKDFSDPSVALPVMAIVSGKNSKSKSDKKSVKEYLAVSSSDVSVSPLASVWCDFRSKPKLKKSSIKKRLYNVCESYILPCAPCLSAPRATVSDRKSETNLKKEYAKIRSFLFYRPPTTIASSATVPDINSKQHFGKKSVNKKNVNPVVAPSTAVYDMSKMVKKNSIKKRFYNVCESYVLPCAPCLSAPRATVSVKKSETNLKKESYKKSLLSSVTPASVNPPAPTSDMRS